MKDNNIRLSTQPLGGYEKKGVIAEKNMEGMLKKKADIIRKLYYHDDEKEKCFQQ